MKTIVVIPARLGSSRLPNKVILDICGKPMVQYVYEAAKKAKKITEVYIAIDDKEVEKICKKFTSNIIMTSKEHESGTDRLAEAIGYIECDNVINVQGDEPLIDPKLISELASALEEEKNTMVSAMHRIKSVEDLKSINSVKVTVDKNYHTLYFSRSIIPNHREELGNILKTQDIPTIYNFYKHIGIYGYSKKFLLEYSQLDQTIYEKYEKLEQLRVLENGYKIKMVKTDYVPIGVDTENDLEKVRKVIIKENSHDK